MTLATKTMSKAVCGTAQVASESNKIRVKFFSLCVNPMCNEFSADF